MGKKMCLLLLSGVLLFALTACGGETAPETRAAVPETTVPVTTAAPTTEPATEPTTVPTEPPEYWRENVMMANPCWLVDKKGNPAGFDNNVLGSKIERTKILTMTFLDTLADMPEDAWDISAEKNGSVMAWVIPSAEQGKMYDLYIGGEGGIRVPDSCNSLFHSYKALREIKNIEHFRVTSDVTDMCGMFGSCEALEAFHVDGWDTSSVVDMGRLFSGCSALVELDLSDWDTSSVEQFVRTFEGCRNLKTLNISTWDTSSAFVMEMMFENCASLEALDVSSFDTSNVIWMHSGFKGCKSLKKLDLSSWDTSKMEDMNKFLWGCESLEELDLGEWETGSIKRYTNFMEWEAKYNGKSWRKLFE